MRQASPRITAAAKRLAQSRTSLQRALRQPALARTADDSPFSSASALAWMAVLHKVPGLELLAQALQAWWMQQPLQPATAATWQALKETLPALAKRHPIALLAGAAALGGVLAMSRPWRWALKPALLTALLPQLLGAILAARAKPPENADLF